MSSADLVRAAARPLVGRGDDYAALLDWIGDARVVLLGEASHGTHEFYRERARITRLLVQERGFDAVAVEADWPDADRVNRFVRGREGGTAVEALGEFRRFPVWMWRNVDVLAFVDWLRAHNAAIPKPEARVGFYGLDLYSLRSSIEAVVGYLDRIDPEAARRARARYGCFDHFGADPQAYGHTALRLDVSCEQAVIAQLVELRRQAAEYARRDGRVAADELFSAEQNARVVTNAEAYYRTMFTGRAESWNLRDRHMADILDALLEHLRGERERAPRVVVWAHNSHVGDARATEMARRGELNIGQLARERHGDATFLVGFTTYTGTVSAASDWDATVERKRVRPALPGSHEALFHETGIADFLLDCREARAATALGTPRLERAIGVIYRPETERLSHYLTARLAEQFDAVVHLDETRAVEPLERTAGWDVGELPETYPFAV